MVLQASTHSRRLLGANDSVDVYLELEGTSPAAALSINSDLGNSVLSGNLQVRLHDGGLHTAGLLTFAPESWRPPSWPSSCRGPPHWSSVPCTTQAVFSVRNVKLLLLTYRMQSAEYASVQSRKSVARRGMMGSDN